MHKHDTQTDKIDHTLPTVLEGAYFLWRSFAVWVEIELGGFGIDAIPINKS